MPYTFSKTLMLIVITGLLITSCNLTGSNETGPAAAFNFETLFDAYNSEAEISDYKTIVIRNRSEAEHFLTTYPTQSGTEEMLLDVDYGHRFVVGVFVGSRPNLSYSVSVDSLTATGNISRVYMTETGSAFGSRAISWPAHFITVDKKEFGNKSIRFAPINRICELDPCAWMR